MKKRILNYDLLRIIACFMVVLIHVSASKWEMVAPQYGSWKAMNLYDSFARTAVPIFL